jgi:putative GTP pyrophosphokinase
MKDFSQIYKERHKEILIELANRVRKHLEGCFKTYPRIDRITARAKSIDSFLKKAQTKDNNHSIYEDPLNQIQDQIGARIILFYKSDIDTISSEVKKYFRFIEEKEIVPDRDQEFGYFGVHFLLLFPSDVFDIKISQKDSPKCFELQIKTLYQHAWSEANHDLGYKPSCDLTKEEKRKIAFTAAQSWGADLIFDELFKSKSSEVKS